MVTHRVGVLADADRATWDALAGGAAGHLEQTTWWAEPLRSYGVPYEVVGWWRDGELVGGALLRFARMPYIGLALGDCLAGPLGEVPPPDVQDEVLEVIASVAKRRRAVQVSFRKAPSADIHDALTSALTRRGARWRTHAEPAKGVVHLAGRTFDEVVASFGSRARRSWRKGRAGPVVVRAVESPTDLRAAYDTWVATAERQDFSELRPWSATEPMLVHCVESGDGEVLAAFDGERMVASIFVTYLGTEAEFVYGGFHADAASLYPNHVLHAAGMESALRRGLATYNLGLLSVTRRAQGVVEFKQSFGIDVVALPDTLEWDTIPLAADAVRYLRSQTWGKQITNRVRRLAVRRGERSSPAS